MEGAAAGEKWREGEGGRTPVLWRECLWCYLTTVLSPWGSPPENKAWISINQVLMKAFGLRKKKLARGYLTSVQVAAREEEFSVIKIETMNSNKNQFSLTQRFFF